MGASVVDVVSAVLLVAGIVGGLFAAVLIGMTLPQRVLPRGPSNKRSIAAGEREDEQ